MDVGVMVPQGWKGEFDGWGAADAWSNAMARTRQAEELGFESLWVFDHFTTVPEPTDEITFESFTMLGAIAEADGRDRTTGQAVAAETSTRALLRSLADEVANIMGRLEDDGRLSRDEAADTIPELEALARKIERALGDLRAKAKA